MKVVHTSISILSWNAWVLGGSIRECSLLESVCPRMFSSEFVAALCAVYLETMVVTGFCFIVIVEIDYHSGFPVSVPASFLFSPPSFTFLFVYRKTNSIFPF
jgi:hypothetical protein